MTTPKQLKAELVIAEAELIRMENDLNAKRAQVTQLKSLIWLANHEQKRAKASIDPEELSKFIETIISVGTMVKVSGARSGPVRTIKAVGQGFQCGTSWYGGHMHAAVVRCDRRGTPLAEQFDVRYSAIDKITAIWQNSQWVSVKKLFKEQTKG